MNLESRLNDGLAQLGVQAGKSTAGEMIRYLEQSSEVADRSYDLLVNSLSRNGEITDQDWEVLTEKKKTARAIAKVS